MFNSIEEIKALNEEAGHCFFSDNTMSFFNSKVYPAIYGGRYFVTSEKQKSWSHSFPRLYSVRRANDDGTIDTVGEGFGEYKTKAQADKAAALLAADEGGNSQTPSECRGEAYRDLLEVINGLDDRRFDLPTVTEKVTTIDLQGGGPSSWIEYNHNRRAATYYTTAPGYHSGEEVETVKIRLADGLVQELERVIDFEALPLW